MKIHQGSISKWMSQTFFVRDLNGKDTQVALEPDLTVQKVREYIAKQKGLTPDGVRLIFNGKELLNDKLLSDCNVSPDSRVHMVLRLMMHCTSGRRE